MKRYKTIILFLSAAGLFYAAGAKPAGAGGALKIGLERVFEHEFEQPLLVIEYPGTDEYAVVEKAGRILLAREGKKEVRVLFDWRKKICSKGYEEGLLGAAFDPDFQKTRRLYLYYSVCDPRSSVISRVLVSPGGPRTPEKSSGAAGFGEGGDFAEEILITIEQPYSNHNGGNIVFGPDGYLYIGTGDGGLYGDPGNRAQDLSSLLGKILRIDVSTKKGYSIPRDNPLATYTKEYTKIKKARQVYAWGLRNPWRFSFDSQTGLLWAGDVGQNKYEEVIIIRKGENHGWRRMEGFHCYSPPVACDDPGFVKPVHEYDHDEGQSITGGYVYRGGRLAGLKGRYVFGDFISGKIWALEAGLSASDGKNHPAELLLQSDLGISSFGQDRKGEILVAGFHSGVIYRLVAR